MGLSLAPPNIMQKKAPIIPAITMPKTVLPTSAEGIAKMEVAGQAIAKAFARIRESILAGERSTLALENIAIEVIGESGCTPSFKGYKPLFSSTPYPFATCISVNSEIVHGMPSAEKILQEGDIVTIDLGANYEGWHADAAITVGVGLLTSEANNLLINTKQALKAAIKAARAGNRLLDVADAVYKSASKNNLTPAQDLTGHFIGNRIHMEPSIPNAPPYSVDLNIVLVPGMTFCIEPMLCVGSGEIELLPDQWTICTKDKSLSAHFEHTLLIEAGGLPARALTLLTEQESK